MRDKDLIINIELEQKYDFSEVDFVLCTGLENDELETANNYSYTLSEMKRLNLPMICANPDKIVCHGNKKADCAGAIAIEYEKIGGIVKYFGKPYKEIYEHAINKFNISNEKIQKKTYLQ